MLKPSARMSLACLLKTENAGKANVVTKNLGIVGNYKVAESVQSQHFLRQLLPRLLYLTGQERGGKTEWAVKIFADHQVVILTAEDKLQ